MKTEGILSGYRALDLTDAKGNVAGKILASMGVDTIKIEPPGGDPGRKKAADPSSRGPNNLNLGWLVNNTGKRGITLDIAMPEGKALFLRLLEKVDIVLESFTPGYLDSLGLGYDELSKVNPKVILTSVTVFGQKGPYSTYKGEELVASAMGGALMTNGYPDRPPVKEALDANLYHANAASALGTVMALFAGKTSGQGQHVDVASQEVSSTRSMTGKIVYQFDKRLIKRSGDRHQMGLHSARWIWQCKDGYLWFNLMGGKVGAPANRALTQWIDDDGFEENPLREMGDWKHFDRSTVDPETRSRLEAAMEKFFLGHTKQEIAEEGARRGVRATIANTPAELTSHPQLMARDFWGAFNHHDSASEFQYPLFFFKASETDNRLKSGAPGIGEHNQQVYREVLGMNDDEIAELKDKNVI